MFSELNWFTYIYLAIVGLFSLVPLITLCVCGVRFFVEEIYWNRELTRQDEMGNSWSSSFKIRTRRNTTSGGSRKPLPKKDMPPAKSDVSKKMSV